eukprot:tig00000842_g4830.t1
MLLRLAQEKIRGLGRFSAQPVALPSSPSPAELWTAVSRSDVPRIEELLSQKVDLLAANSDGFTALHLASQSGNVQVTSMLLRAKPELVKLKNVHGDTALIIACKQGHLKIAEMILQKGGDPNASNNFRSTALHEAARKGDHDICELLLNSKANPLFPDYLGNTPAALAADGGHLKLVEFLLKADHTTVNVKNALGNTIMHFAAQHGSVDLMRLLLSIGASAGVKNNRGNTPLHRAALFGHVEAAKVLLGANADPHTQNQFEETPIALAIEYKHPEVAELLLKSSRNLAAASERSIHH